MYFYVSMPEACVGIELQVKNTKGVYHLINSIGGFKGMIMLLKLFKIHANALLINIVQYKTGGASTHALYCGGD